jgi:anti-sigma B factor antagonist
MPTFNIAKQKLQNGVVFLSVSGFLDAHTFEELEKTISEMFDQNAYRLIIDLSKLDYISSAGAGVFIGAIGTAQENDGNIVIVKPSPNVREVFDLLGLSQIFTFAETRDAALKEFS